jgi:hypothetical protein
MPSTSSYSSLDPEFPLPSVEEDDISDRSVVSLGNSTDVEPPSQTSSYHFPVVTDLVPRLQPPSFSPSNTGFASRGNSSDGGVTIPASQASSEPGESAQEVLQELERMRVSTSLPSPTSSRPAMPSNPNEVPDSMNMASLRVGLRSLENADNPSQSSLSASVFTPENTPGPAENDNSIVLTSRASRSPRSRRSGTRPIDLGPHEVQNEDPPDDDFHKPEFQALIRDVNSLVKEVAAVLGTCPFAHEPGASIKRLYSQTQAISPFHCKSERFVGFVGESGVGKRYIWVLKKKKKHKKNSSGGHVNHGN